MTSAICRKTTRGGVMNLNQKVARMASLMAISNMGLLHPNYFGNRDYLQEPFGDHAEYDIMSIAGHFIETDEIEEGFIAEARMWEEEVGKVGLEGMLAKYPHHHDWMERLINL